MLQLLVNCRSQLAFHMIVGGVLILIADLQLAMCVRVYSHAPVTCNAGMYKQKQNLDDYEILTATGDASAVSQ